MNNLTESFILTNEDEYINFEKFDRGESNILYIVGLCGSGKSTIGKELAKKYKAEYIELDEIERTLLTAIGSQRLQSLRPKQYYDLLLKNLLKEIGNKKVIIEGIQILFMDTEFFKGKPIAFKNTSFLTSSLRAAKRDYKIHKKIEYARYLNFNFELETMKRKMINTLKS